MPVRSVQLPVFDLLSPSLSEGVLISALSGVHGVSAVTLGGGQMLAVEYDPVCCGPSQLLVALESAGRRPARAFPDAVGPSPMPSAWYRFETRRGWGRGADLRLAA